MQHVPTPTCAPTVHGRSRKLYDAIATTLCFGNASSSDSYLRPIAPAGDTSCGLFAQLNTFVQQLVENAYSGRGVAGGDLHTAIYAHPIRSYGDRPLSAWFEPRISCKPSSGCRARHSLGWATAELRSAPRYLVASHLLYLLFRPRAGLAGHDGGSPAFDVAIHARRGDKLALQQTHTIERIALPGEEALTQQALAVLGCVRGSAAPTLAAVASLSPPPRVLIATDDAAFGEALSKRLVATAGAVVTRLGGTAPNDASSAPTNVSASSLCGAACVPALLELVDGFVRARSLVVSLGSNLGGFLLTAWAAHNHDATPPFLDVDGRVLHRHVAQRRLYFCELQWGSRHGLCGPPAEWTREAAAAWAAEQAVEAQRAENATEAVASDIKEAIRTLTLRLALGMAASSLSGSHDAARSHDGADGVGGGGAVSRAEVASHFDALLARSLGAHPTTGATWDGRSLLGGAMERFLAKKTSGPAHEVVDILRERLAAYQHAHGIRIWQQRVCMSATRL